MKVEIFYSKNAKKNAEAVKNCEPAKILADLYQRKMLKSWRPDRKITGDSYETGYDLMLDLSQVPEGKGFSIVSGAMEDGKFVHCWLEHGDWVIDFSNGRQRIFGQKFFYDQAKVDKKRLKTLTSSQFRRKVEKLAAEEQEEFRDQLQDLRKVIAGAEKDEEEKSE